MEILAFEPSDLTALLPLKPPDWDDITPAFKNYLETAYCRPIKAVAGGKLVGVGATISHEDTIWLSHILVHEDFRNQGIGNGITQALVAYAREQGFKTIFLIATALGYPVYLKNGFEVEMEYLHFKKRNPKQVFQPSDHIRPLSSRDYEAVFYLDEITTGEKRQKKLKEGLANGVVFEENGEVGGFYMPALGDGIIVADDPEAGIDLMKYRLQHKFNAALPESNTAGVEFLMANDFELVIAPKRMRLGEPRNWRPANLYNRIGGNLG